MANTVAKSATNVDDLPGLVGVGFEVNDGDLVQRAFFVSLSHRDISFQNRIPDKRLRELHGESPAPHFPSTFS